MRIIDKNTDFYDFLQNVYHDDSLTFDRTDSFLLTKEMFCSNLKMFYRDRFLRRRHLLLHDYNFALLQICNTFWLFLIETTSYSDNDGVPHDYDIELLKKWKNYDKKRELIKLDIITLNWELYYYLRNKKTWVDKRNNIVKNIDKIISAIDTNDYQVYRQINWCDVRIGGGKSCEKHIPLLKACGIGNCIDPLDVFLSFEEYFSLEKTSSERRESIGLTDKEKVESHGFDTKTSFRKM